MSNKNLTAAKNSANDEFYTQIQEIRSEVAYYIDEFAGKTVFCNCDDPFESNFVLYFLTSFNRLRLKELVATGYKTSSIGGTDIGRTGEPYALRVTSTKKYLVGTQTDLDPKGAKYFLECEGSNIMSPLCGNVAKDKNGEPIMAIVKDKNGKPVKEEVEIEVTDKRGNRKKKKRKMNKTEPVFYEAGDFRSDMCVELLRYSDIVCTNPPFSLFREYVAQLMEYKKQFLILGNINAITYKEFFPLLKENKVWIGCVTGSKEYFASDNYVKKNPNKVYKRGNVWYAKMGNTCWYTNIDHVKRHQMLPLDLGYTYYGHEDMYPKYDNYDAINVDTVAQIPCDYEPCWYKCPHAASCRYAQTRGEEDKALCEQACDGEIGVPISYMDKYCPEQFELIGNGGSYAGDGSVASELFINDNGCSQNVQVERERGGKSSSESSFENCRKCNGIIGVPISFFDRYCPEQFRIVGVFNHGKDGPWDFATSRIGGIKKYKRLAIQKV